MIKLQGNSQWKEKIMKHTLVTDRDIIKNYMFAFFAVLSCIRLVATQLACQKSNQSVRTKCSLCFDQTEQVCCVTQLRMLCIIRWFGSRSVELWYIKGTNESLIRVDLFDLIWCTMIQVIFDHNLNHPKGRHHYIAITSFDSLPFAH